MHGLGASNAIWPGNGVGRTTIPSGSNLGQVVHSHCLRSFSAPRNWRTKV